MGRALAAEETVAPGDRLPLGQAEAGRCNICGGGSFTPGPAGRLSENGLPPACQGCGALERHRALRRLLEGFRIGTLSWRRALQFSSDVAIRPEWFRSYEVSIYGGRNSIDIQKICKPQSSYDFISLNHVMEFVEDPVLAFRELDRILSGAGILQIGFSNAHRRESCEHYPIPRGTHKYYHLFGKDLGEFLDLREGNIGLELAGATDPVTGVREWFHFFSRDRGILLEISSIARCMP